MMKNNKWTFLIIAAAVGLLASLVIRHTRSIREIQLSAKTPPQGIIREAHSAHVNLSTLTATSVVAVLQGMPIPYSHITGEIANMTATVLPQISADMAGPMQSNIFDFALDGYITRQLLTAEADQCAVTVSSQEVTRAVDDFAARLPPDRPLEKFLQEHHYPMEEFRQNTEYDLRVGKLFDILTRNIAPPTEEEVSRFYEANKSEFVVPGTGTQAMTQIQPFEAVRDQIRKDLWDGIRQKAEHEYVRQLKNSARITYPASP